MDVGFMLAEGATYKDIVLPRYWASRKWDGERIMAHVNGNDVRLINRRGNEKSLKFPEVAEALKKLDLKKTVLDGEVVCFKDGKDDRVAVQVRSSTENPLRARLLRQESPVKYIVFDILCYCGRGTESKADKVMRALDRDDGSFVNLHYKDRRAILEEMWPGDNEALMLCPIAKTDKQKIALWEEVIKKGWEGVMLNDIDARHIDKRTSALLKCKNHQETILQFNRYEINNAGATLETADGIRVQCAGEQSKEVVETIKKNGWVKCEIQYLYTMKSGALFQPTFKAMVTA